MQHLQAVVVRSSKAFVWREKGAHRIHELKCWTISPYIILQRFAEIIIFH